MKSWTTICRLHVVMAVLLGVLFFPGCSRELAPAERDPVVEANALGPDEVGEVCGYAYSDLVASEWATSEDGAVSMRLLSPREPSAIDEPFVLLVELRNNTEEVMTFFHGGRSIQITRPDGSKIDWHPAPSATASPFAAPSPPFRCIGPGVTVCSQDSLECCWLDQPSIYGLEVLYTVAPEQQYRIEHYLGHPEEYPYPARPRRSELPARGWALLAQLFPSPDPTKTVPPLWTGELHVGPLVVARR
jgi:hypothetical protein